MGDDTVDLSGDVGAVGRILLHAPDDDVAEPAIPVPGRNASVNPATNGSKHDADTCGPDIHSTEPAIHKQRALPAQDEANDLAGDGSYPDANNATDGAAEASKVAKEVPNSNGADVQETSNGQGGSIGRRQRKVRKGGSTVDEDETSEDYQESEGASEGGSDGDYDNRGAKKRRRGPVEAGKTAKEDNRAHELKHGFVIDLKGVMFSANVVQMPCTALVLHVGESQAKVRSIHGCVLACLMSSRGKDFRDGAVAPFERFSFLLGSASFLFGY
jgi:hypothetical protein